MADLLSLLNRFENAAGVYERSTDKSDREELHAVRRAIMEAFASIEQERDEATNWTDIVERHGTDQFDDLAEVWLALPAIKRVTAAVTSVFTKWANDEMMERFRTHQLSMFHMAYVEGCLAGVKASEAGGRAIVGRDAAITAERDAAKADEIYAAKLMLRFRDTLSNIVDGVADEGDRVYFGSTNACDELREVAEAIEELNWDRVLASSQKKPDLYADLRELRATVAKHVERDAELVKALERIFSYVSYVNIHGVGVQPEPRADGQPQVVRVSPEEFAGIFQEIGNLASAALRTVTP